MARFADANFKCARWADSPKAEIIRLGGNLPGKTMGCGVENTPMSRIFAKNKIPRQREIAKDRRRREISRFLESGEFPGVFSRFAQMGI